MRQQPARDPQLSSILARTADFGQRTQMQASALSRVRADLDGMWFPGATEGDLAWLIRPHGRAPRRRRA